MKGTGRLGAVAIAVVFLVVFGLAEDNQCPDLSEAQKENLVAEAKIIFATANIESETRQSVGINPAPYPHLSRLSPKQVTLRSDGLYIRMKEGFVTECGYFIPGAATHPAELAPGGDPSYKKTGDTFYTYRIRG